MSIWPTVLPSGVNERSTVTHRAVNRAGSVRNFGFHCAAAIWFLQVIGEGKFAPGSAGVYEGVL